MIIKLNEILKIEVLSRVSKAFLKFFRWNFENSFISQKPES